MPFRTRIKRVFAFGSPDDEGASGKSYFKSSKKDPRLNDPNVYQPGEKMPPLKYRRPVCPEHKAHLESFTWANAWRRASLHSQYSPHGSRMPSRRGSNCTQARKSMDCDPMDCGLSSRGNDCSDCVGIDSGFGGSIADTDIPGTREGSDEEVEASNDNKLPLSTTWSDLSKPSSGVGYRDTSLSVRTSTSIKFALPPHPNSRRIDRPFTPEELATALRRSNLDATVESSDGCSNYTADNLEERLQKADSRCRDMTGAMPVQACA